MDYSYEIVFTHIHISPSHEGGFQAVAWRR